MNDQLQNLSERLKYIRDNKIYAFEYILGISEESSFASSGRITSEQPQEDLQQNNVFFTSSKRRGSRNHAGIGPQVVSGCVRLSWAMFDPLETSPRFVSPFDRSALLKQSLCTHPPEKEGQMMFCKEKNMMFAFALVFSHVT